MSEPDDRPRLMTKQQAAAYCGVSAPTFTKWVLAGDMPGPFKSTRMYDRRAIDLVQRGQPADDFICKFCSCRLRASAHRNEAADHAKNVANAVLQFAGDQLALLFCRTACGNVDVGSNELDRFPEIITLNFSLGQDPSGLSVGRSDYPIFDLIVGVEAINALLEMAYDSIAILGMDPRNPRLVTFVRSICRQSMNRQVFRGSLVAKCAFSEIDFKAPDLSDALHARELDLRASVTASVPRSAATEIPQVFRAKILASVALVPSRRHLF